MQKSHAVFLFSVILLIAHVKCKDTDDRDVNGETNDVNYENYEEEEEGETSAIPKFSATEVTVKVNPGENASLNCIVDDLGPYDLIFRKGVDSNAIIAMGSKILDHKWIDKIVLTSLENNTGLTMTLKNVSAEDEGTYVCLLNFSEVKNSVIFHLEVNDENETNDAVPSSFFHTWILLLSVFVSSV